MTHLPETSSRSRHRHARSPPCDQPPQPGQPFKHALARAKSTRHPYVLGHLPDGSCLSHLDGLKVRIIEATLTMTGDDGSRICGSYRLITTLTGPPPVPGSRRGPALPRAPGDRIGVFRCGTPCPTAACCARVTGPAW